MDQISLQQLLLLAVGTIDVLIAAYVLSRNPRHATHRAFFLFVAGAAAWGFGIVLLSLTGSFFFDKVIFYGGTFMVFGLVFLARVFPTAESISRRFWLLCLPLGVILLLIPFNVFVKETIVHPGGRLEPILGSLFLAYVAVIGFYIFASLFLFATTYRRISGLARLRMQYLSAGAAIFIVAAFLFDVLLPVFGIFTFNLLGPIASIIFVGFTAYAIVRYQLMDIRVIIQRGVIYAAFATVVFLAYLSFTLLLGGFVIQYTGAIPFISAALAAIIVVLGYKPLDGFLRKITDHFFFQKHYRSPEILFRSSEILNSTLDFSRAIGELSELLKETLKVPRIYVFTSTENRLDLFSVDHKRRTAAALALGGKLAALFPSCVLEIRGGVCANDLEVLMKTTGAKNPCRRTPEALARLLEVFREHDLALLTPFFTKGALSGLMAFGMKRSSDRFSDQDRELLRAIVHQVGIALENYRLYKAQQRHAQSLEQQVSERTQALGHLYETQMQLIQDLSHALQTPLAVVKSALDATLKVRLGEPDRKNIRTLEQTCVHMSEIIRRILILARSETEREAFERASVSLSDLLQDLGEQMAILAADKGINFQVEIGDHMPVLGDREKLRELFAELLSNALKYTSSGGTIKMTLRKKENTARVAISDTGFGIPRGDLPHIFERFYRVQRHGKQADDGIGLGLAIAESIAKSHGGDIITESVFGKGSTFTVELPLFNARAVGGKMKKPE